MAEVEASLKQEIEVKLPVRRLDWARDRLRRAGAHCEGASDEENIVFDRDGELRGRQELLRLRRDRRVRLTWKGPAEQRAGVKSRPEAEITIDDFATGREILERLGYREVVSYAKHRETWAIDGVEVVLDRLEFGDFVEIEGDHDQIAAVAATLELDLSAVLADSYVALQTAFRAGRLRIERYADE